MNLDADNRLRRRVVRVLFEQDWVSVIESGVRAGDKVVVSDLVPAVPGMLLLPRPDEDALKRLTEDAAGGSAAK